MRTSIEDAECESIALEVVSRAHTAGLCVSCTRYRSRAAGQEGKKSCTVLTLASFYPSAEVGYTAVPSRTFNRGAGRRGAVRVLRYYAEGHTIKIV